MALPSPGRGGGGRGGGRIHARSIPFLCDWYGECTVSVTPYNIIILIILNNVISVLASYSLSVSFPGRVGGCSQPIAYSSTPHIF